VIGECFYFVDSEVLKGSEAFKNVLKSFGSGIINIKFTHFKGAAACA
jgi:hypothetical protein